jgi:hypothetical protein
MLFAYKGTKEPLYFLGIPFLMFMSDSLFFNKAKIFHIPGSLDDQLLFLWLIALWLFSKIIDKNPPNKRIGNSKSFLPDFCIVVLIIITIIDFLLIVINYPILTNVVHEFFTDISLFVGYFIIKNWVSSNKPEVIRDFLYCIVVANSIAAILYILNQGLHFNIYPSDESMSEIFQGEEVTRNFFFMPQFLFFSVTYIVVFTKKYSIISMGLLIVNLLAIFISYTRSSVIIAVLIFLLFLTFTSLKKRKFSTLLKNIILYSILSIIGVFILSKFFPLNTEYLMHRFSDLTQSSASRGEPNDLAFRFTNTEEVISKIDRNKKTLGMGPITKAQSAQVPNMEQTTSDMVWTGVIFRWGILGMILFGLIYIFSTFNAFRFFMTTEGILSDLGLLFLIYIISQIVESFVSWTFLSGHGWATGLWYFAMLYALIGFNKKEILVNEEIFSKMKYPTAS